MTGFDISFLCVSMSHSLPQGPESQMSHIPGPLSILVMHCGGDTHTPTHTQASCMAFSEVCDWILGTVGACQVAAIRGTELHCCL